MMNTKNVKPFSEWFKGDIEISDPEQVIESKCTLTEESTIRLGKYKWIKQAYKEAYLQFYKSLFSRQFVSDFMNTGEVPYEPVNNEYRELIDKARDAVLTKPPYILLTINPRPDIKLLDFMKKVEKFVKRKMISHYMYCYEVRNEEGGIHCHMLVRYVSKPYDFKRGAKSTFKDICEVNNPQILNFRYITDEQLPDKIKYISGDKADKKQDSVQATKTFRNKHNLQDLYHSTPILSCRGTEKPLITEI